MIIFPNKCKDCGGKITMTEREYAFYQEKKFNDPTHCKTCKDKRKYEGYGFICSDCNKPFFMDGLELETFKNKHGKEPCKCKECFYDKGKR